MLTDLEILKPLIERIIDLSGRPTELVKKRMWADHQSLRPTSKIPVCVYYEGIPEGTWQTILGSDYLRCSDPLARSIERDLRKRLWMADHVPDDHIVWPAVFVGAVVARELSWGVPLERRFAGGPLGAYEIVAPLKDGIDLSRVKFSDQEIDESATARQVERAYELLGEHAGRVAVHVHYPNLGYGPFDTLVLMRGLEQTMMDAADRPEELLALMEVITEGFEEHHENRQWRGHINCHPMPMSNDDCRMSNEEEPFQIWGYRVHCYRPFRPPVSRDRQGARSSPTSSALGDRTVGVSTANPHPRPLSQGEREELPRLSDEWAYVSAQMSSGFGPGMYARLVQPFNVRLASYFTNQTVYYHGCEPLDHKLDVIAELPNLRRHHVSPWSSVAAAAKKFQGRVVMEVHAHPGKVCLSGTVETIRAELRDLVAQGEGLPMDLDLSDIHSVGKDPAVLGVWAREAQTLAPR